MSPWPAHTAKSRNRSSRQENTAKSKARDASGDHVIEVRRVCELCESDFDDEIKHVCQRFTVQLFTAGFCQAFFYPKIPPERGCVFFWGGGRRGSEVRRESEGIHIKKERLWWTSIMQGRVRGEMQRLLGQHEDQHLTINGKTAAN